MYYPRAGLGQKPDSTFTGSRLLGSIEGSIEIREKDASSTGDKIRQVA
jgi:hypothetical protein